MIFLPLANNGHNEDEDEPRSHLAHRPDDMCAHGIWQVQGENTVKLRVFVMHREAVHLIYDDVDFIPETQTAAFRKIKVHKRKF